MLFNFQKGYQTNLALLQTLRKSSWLCQTNNNMCSLLQWLPYLVVFYGLFWLWLLTVLINYLHYLTQFHYACEVYIQVIGLFASNYYMILIYLFESNYCIYAHRYWNELQVISSKNYKLHRIIIWFWFTCLIQIIAFMHTDIEIKKYRLFPTRITNCFFN